MNLHMIRAVRLVNARQVGLSSAAFLAALDDANLSSAFTELLSRRGQSVARSAVATIVGGMSAAEATEHILSQSAFAPYILASSAVMTVIAADSASVAAIAASSGAMTIIAASTTAMTAIATSSVAMGAVIASGTALTAVFAVPAAKSKFAASTALAKASIPKMTSNTTPSGLASSSSVYSGYPAYQAFDKDAETFWAGGAGLATNQWIKYSFAGDVFISTVTAESYGADYSPVNCRIECSSDNITFDVVKSFVMNPVGVNTLDVTKAGFYKHWRLFIETIDGSSHPGVKELNFTGFVKPA